MIARRRRTALVLVLWSVLLLPMACAPRHRQPDYNDWRTGIERPAKPIAEEESLVDKIGEVGVVVLVVVVTVGGILLPILLL